MAVTVFTRDFGTSQGRIQPQSIEAPDGSYVMCLGSDVDSVPTKIPGDGECFIQAVQTADWPAAGRLLRFKIRTRPNKVPYNLGWRFSVGLAFESALAFVVDQNDPREYNEVTLSLRQAAGSSVDVTVRLDRAGFSPSDVQEVDLPGVYFDDIVVDTDTTRPVLANRIPGPGETNVPVDVTLKAYIFDTMPGGTIPTELRAWVNDVVAYDPVTGFQAGFNGAGSSVGTFNQGGALLWIDPTTDFTSLQVVTVRVSARIQGTLKSVTVADVGANTFTATTHGLAQNAPVMVESNVLPAPLQAFTLYYIDVVDVDTVRLLFTPGGSVVDITDAGTGPHNFEHSIPNLSLDKTWSFVCEDLTTPILESAMASSITNVRATFNEPMKALSASASDDALNPTNYVLTRLTTPAVDADVASVALVSAREFDLATDMALSPGATYRLTVLGVKDTSENIIVAPDNTATFLGFIPPQPGRRSWQLIKFLPLVNRQEDLTEDLARFIACLQEVTDLTLFDIDRWTTLLDPDFAPDAWLDVMLADLGNPFPFELDEVDKRRLLRVLVKMYQEKGTAIGIANAILFFLGVEVGIDAYNTDPDQVILGESELGVDWNLGASEQFLRFSFQILSSVILTPDQRTKIADIANFLKPAHTHFVRLVEPEAIVVDDLDHLELGLSELGENWELHDELVVTDGLKFWLRADRQVTLVSDDVSSWTDTAHSITASQASAGERPDFETAGLGGQACVKGRDATTNLDVTGLVVPTEATIIFVYGSENTASANRYVIAGSSNNFGIIDGFTSPSKVEWFNTEADRFTLATTPATGPHIYAVTQRNTGPLTGYFDGGQVFTKPVAAVNLETIGTLMNATGLTTNGTLGRLAEVIVYNRILSASELSTVTHYLKTRYGVA